MQLRRGDKAVLSISAGLAAIVVAAVAFSLLVVDRSPPPSKQPGNSSSSLLVMTWGPSLCRVERNNSGCRSGHVEKLGRTLILHGLWPQPPTEQFCDVPKADEGRARDHLRDTDIASLDLPQDVQSKLQSMMSDIKAMVPHEWYAHGSCSGVTPAVYFSDAVTLADQLGRILDTRAHRCRTGRRGGRARQSHLPGCRQERDRRLRGATVASSRRRTWRHPEHPVTARLALQRPNDIRPMPAWTCAVRICSSFANSTAA